MLCCVVLCVRACVCVCERARSHFSVFTVVLPSFLLAFFCPVCANGRCSRSTTCKLSTRAQFASLSEDQAMSVFFFSSTCCMRACVYVCVLCADLLGKVTLASSSPPTPPHHQHVAHTRSSTCSSCGVVFWFAAGSQTNRRRTLPLAASSLLSARLTRHSVRLAFAPPKWCLSHTQTKSPSRTSARARVVCGVWCVVCAITCVACQAVSFSLAVAIRHANLTPTPSSSLPQKNMKMVPVLVPVPVLVCRREALRFAPTLLLIGFFLYSMRRVSSMGGAAGGRGVSSMRRGGGG